MFGESTLVLGTSSQGLIPCIPTNFENGEHLVEYNKAYCFKLEDVSFPGIEKEKLYKLYQDGRVSSSFIQLWLESQFNLKYVNGNGYDHLDEKQNKYELKSLTKYGCNLCPSHMVGSGRKKDISLFREEASKINFIISDITNFPEIKVVFKTGEEIVRLYPNAVIAKNDKKIFV